MGNRPGTSMGNRPGTSAGQRPDTAGSDIQALGEDCSDLTYGSGGVICGNPVRALRNRRKKQVGARKLKGVAWGQTQLGQIFQSLGDGCSDLTCGSGGVICGNPVRALRNRRKKQGARRLNGVAWGQTQLGQIFQSLGDGCSDLTYGSGGVICGNPVRA